MAQQTMTLNCTASALIREDSKNTNYHGAESYDVFPIGLDRALLLSFDSFPSAQRKKLIYSANLMFSGQVNKDYIYYAVARYGDGFNENTVTYKTGPSDYKWLSLVYPDSTSLERLTEPLAISDLADTVTWEISADSDLGRYYSNQSAIVYTRNATSSRRPTIVVVYDDTVLATSKVVSSLPANGKRMDPTQAITFSWGLVKDNGESVDPFVQTSATFYWSSDSGTTWNSVAVSGSTQSVTIPANTFPGATIQWKVTATDDRGATTTSATRTIDTTDTLPTVTLLQPLDSLESNDGPILFKWKATNASGTLPTSYRLSWREAAVTPEVWTYQEFPAGTTEWLAPANTFPAGLIYWWVLARNRDNANGPWSSRGQFQSIGAPAAPIVSADGAPFTTIDWQVAGQQAWRMNVDGKAYGPYFGGDKTFTLPDYLEDGEHVAAVEVQGQYGLWSQPGVVTFTVTNVPGDAVALKAVCYRDAELSWETDSTTRDFLIYRDGVRIGHSNRLKFTDRRSIGRHSWQVINRLAGGYYTASNVVQDELRSCTPAAALLSGGEWLELRKSDAQTREDIWQGSQTAAIRHFAGEEYPTAEFAAFKDETVSLTVAWMPEEAEEARRFESMIGQPVIYKNRDRMLIGVLQAFNMRRPQFYRSYSVTLTRVHWRDYIDEDP